MRPVPVCPVKAVLASLYMEGGAVAFCSQQGVGESSGGKRELGKAVTFAINKRKVSVIGFTVDTGVIMF